MLRDHQILQTMKMKFRPFLMKDKINVRPVRTDLQTAQRLSVDPHENVGINIPRFLRSLSLFVQFFKLSLRNFFMA